MKNVLKVLAFLSLAIGFRVYSKNSTHDDLKGQIITACAGSEICETIVEKKYDVCFEKSYTMGRHSRFDEDTFTNCMGH